MGSRVIKPPADMDPKWRSLAYLLIVFGAPLFLFIAFAVALPMFGLSFGLGLAVAALIAGVDYFVLRHLFSGYRG